MTSVPTTGPTTKNFVKKKESSQGGTILENGSSVGNKRKTMNDTSSVTSEKSNIYKPNLRKGTASSMNKPSKPEPKER
jgi:hypothetical protein